MSKSIMILDIINNPPLKKGLPTISHMVVKSDYGKIESIYSNTPFPSTLKKLDFIKYGTDKTTGFVKDIEKTTIPKDVQYLISSDFQTQLYVNTIERSILEGKDPSQRFKGIKKFIKTLGTEITLPTKKHPVERFQEGKSLFTYSSVHFMNGKVVPKLDVWTDTHGMITDENINKLSSEEKEAFLAAIIIKKGYAILSNGNVKYPKDWPDANLIGKDVKGTRQKDGTFVVDQENGNDFLRDEWLAPLETVLGTYEITPKEETVVAYKAFPTYGFTPNNSFMQNQDGLVWEYGDKINDTVCISLSGKGKITGSSVVREQAFESSYMDWDQYWKMQNKDSIGKENPRIRSIIEDPSFENQKEDILKMA